ncbi:HutD/Ves family protein [Neopusillimonas aromaticivorans]|uniref:HutD/Ves family protein n=1 Tax=Neopusillimonas aromaticivorans TaxID=2979868 RepID=UPI0025978DDD|nr:HutD family protein [Neopusillimonas aromaticivorans]WJJ94430.1 HutD family protein [Neopusillimonas aromaticivorans]
MNVLNVLQLAPVPWRNGQGQTREIETFPPGADFDDFIWRISLADIAQAGDFSAFDGVDRIITLVKGTGVNLNFNDGERHALEYGVPYPFAGERPLHATLRNGPVQDLNLMLRRGLAEGHVQAWSTTLAWPCPPVQRIGYCAFKVHGSCTPNAPAQPRNRNAGRIRLCRCARPSNAYACNPQNT